MAILQALASAQVEDSRNEVVSFDQPFEVDTSVAAINDLSTWIQGLGASVDTITDGKITKLRLSLLIPLPSGIKSTPVAGSDNEKTGLITLAASGTPYNYGTDVPAFPNSKLTGNQVNTGDTQVAAFIAYITTTTLTGITPTDRGYHALLDTIRHAILTFRKHRRSLRRA